MYAKCFQEFQTSVVDYAMIIMAKIIIGTYLNGYKKKLKNMTN